MDKPLNEMPLHFRFLYNLGRIFWEKESLWREAHGHGATDAGHALH